MTMAKAIGEFLAKAVKLKLVLADFRNLISCPTFCPTKRFTTKNKRIGMVISYIKSKFLSNN